MYKQRVARDGTSSTPYKDCAFLSMSTVKIKNILKWEGTDHVTIEHEKWIVRIEVITSQRQWSRYDEHELLMQVCYYNHLFFRSHLPVPSGSSSLDTTILMPS